MEQTREWLFRFAALLVLIGGSYWLFHSIETDQSNQDILVSNSRADLLK